MLEEAPPGLRERKKLDTRKALSDAALELMFERGLDNFVREDVAARAGVSLRTFSNYFASKYDALAYRVNHRLRRSAELLRARPADEPLWTAIAEALIEPLRDDGVPFGRPTHEQLLEIRKLNAAPEMQVALARHTLDDLVEAIAERTGTDPEADLYPRLVAGVTMGAVNAVLHRYVRNDPPVAMSSVLREVFAGIAAGLPPPPRTA
jgi:AcrR family transcriptional regulator